MHCVLLATTMLLLAPAASLRADAPKPLKVFILAGQSNVEGQAVADLGGKDYNGGKGTLKYLLKDPAKAPLLRHLANDRGGPSAGSLRRFAFGTRPCGATTWGRTCSSGTRENHRPETPATFFIAPLPCCR
jgi:hypothetical protein